jgi:hypothetical protein
VCDCKNFWFISVPAKKGKLNQCVIAAIWHAFLQPVVMCGCKKKENLTLSVWLKSYLVVWNMIASLGSV